MSSFSAKRLPSVSIGWLKVSPPGHDAHDAGVLEAGEIVPAPQRLQHVAHALRLAARVVEIEIDAKALGSWRAPLATPPADPS